MARKWKTRSSNLFHIDLDIVEKTLADANAPLLNKAEEMLDEAGRFSDNLTSLEDAERLKVFIKTLRSQTREVSNARLSDGRPFTDAAGFVKEWFGKTENKLKAANKRLSAILSSYASLAQREAAEVRRRNTELQTSQNSELDDDSSVVGISVTGTPILTVNRPPREEQNIEIEEVPETPNVELVWQVQNFDRESLDLEQLRPFLTDHAIKSAINWHIKENGPNQLNGVVYEQVITNRL